MRKLFIILILVSPTFAQAPQISNEELLKFRNLQYSQVKLVLRMQNLKTEFDKLNTESMQIQSQMENWIKEQAVKYDIDLTKYNWDSDQLKFVEIKKNESKNPS